MHGAPEPRDERPSAHGAPEPLVDRPPAHRAPEPLADRPPAAESQTSASDRDIHRLRNGLLWTGGLATLALAVGLAVPNLREVLDRAGRADAGWLALAVALEIGSCLGYVAVLRLVLHSGPAREVRRLAWAEMAFGAVVQVGGAGGLAVGAWAMRAWGIAWSRVASRSAVIFLLTSAVNVAVLGLAGAGILLGLGSRVGIALGLVPLVAGGGAIVAGLLLPLVVARAPARRVFRGSAHLADWVRDTERILTRRDRRLVGALAYLLLDIAALWACLRAVGEAPPVLALVAGYQIGYLSNLIPVPGGIGVLDGGLLAALALYGLPVAPTATAIVLYHALTLWIPALGGTYGFLRLRRSLLGADARPAFQSSDDPAATLSQAA